MRKIARPGFIEVLRWSIKLTPQALNFQAGLWPLWAASRAFTAFCVCLWQASIEAGPATSQSLSGLAMGETRCTRWVKPAARHDLVALPALHGTLT
jgi:hypothetical protein